ncbi:hypothetical protein BH11CYA1_BH11CYA1_27480 [soil metagenome]
MDTAILIFVWVLNFGISWLNAWGCGKAWAEAKAAGGWPRFMVWMGAIMAASGFTWCFLLPLSLGAVAFDFLPAHYGMLALKLGYVLIIPGILFSGLMITIDSWARAFREGGVLNYGVATYNTFAQVHNTMSAMSTFGDALSDVVSGFSVDLDGEDGLKLGLALAALALVALSVVAGIVVTVLIIKRTAASDRLMPMSEMHARAQ